jgi:hypothetical protein
LNAILCQRLAGAIEWKDPMDLAIQLVCSMGGPNAFLNKRFSKERQFIVEQTVCQEIIGKLLHRILKGILAMTNQYDLGD